MSTDAKWMINRAGLLNFWYYDEEEFHFSDGKLLLRGDNGSGKSVTMQSLIPILLDGRKSPDRLDPFGSRSRKMEDYLLGEKELVDRDERTGYLYLEYKRKGVKQYFTTGIGLRAKRHSTMDFWGFIVQDNRRIGRDLKLYKTEYSGEDGKKVKVPLSRQELENRLGQGGRLVRGQKEYMELVNKHIFGFESIEAYEELIKLLIQLRSPKLSKDFKPTVIYEILNESLPALSDEELRPLSDTIENMDQTKQQMEQLQRDQQALKKLCRHYDRYNRYVLAEKADGFLKAAKDVRRHKKRVDDLKVKHAEELHKQEQYLLQMQELQQEKHALDEEYRALRKHDVFNMEEEKQQLEKKIAELLNQEVQKKTTLGQKQQKERSLQDEINREEEVNYHLQADLEDRLSELQLEAQECSFDGHALAAAEFEEQFHKEQEFHFGLWKDDAAGYLQKVECVLRVLEEEARAKEKYREADLELADARKELDLRRLDEKKWYGFFEEEKEKLLAAVHKWLEGSTEIHVTEEEIQQLIRSCRHLYEEYSYEEARRPLQEARQRCWSRLEKERIGLTHQIEEKHKTKSEIEEEIKAWKERKEPEPQRHPDTAAAREELEQAGIPYLPFFAAVEFKPDVPAAVRERLESAITQMGFLDALIVPESHTQKHIENNRVITPNPHILAHTLAEYLYPTPPQDHGITAGDIDAVLRSILVGEEQQDAAVPEIAADGSYRLSLLAGHAPLENEAVYIGKEARLNHRKQAIARLTEDLADVMEQLNALQHELEKLNARRQRLVAEYEAFPRDADVSAAFTNYKELHLQVKAQSKEVDRANEKLKGLLEKLQQAREKVRMESAEMPLEPNEETYRDALGHMKEYTSCLQKLEITYHKYFATILRLAQFRTNLQDVQEDVDGLKGELNVLAEQLTVYNRQLTEVFQKLEELGAREIRQEIEKIQKRLGVIPNEMVESKGKERDAGNAVLRIAGEIVQKETEGKAAAELASLWENVFIDEYRLHLLGDQEELPVLQDNNALKLAGDIMQKIGSVLTETDRDKAAENLNHAFYQEQGVLVEYRPNLDTVLEMKVAEDHFLYTLEDENIRIKTEQLIRISRRVQLMLEYSGKRVSPYFVLKEMKKDIELQQMILSEKDRQLYEDIIVHSVGRLIRSRIYRAEKWVKQIDTLMANRDTSSGLTFSLRWKPRTAESEDELDTQDLVEILRRDSHLLSERDLDKVTRHFRSQIERAKESMAEKGYGETLHQVIKEMLDYRRWFAFTLYYRKEGEAKKELTNHVFFTFSGGEKAMAMYIPLFSAAYSRYLDARDDAPFIISLDEAFAGVDERNIRDMFDLVEKLEFNYIMNSQALWGDYDTVPALSIHELIRPQNAPYVSVIRYSWNGKIRRMVRPQDVLPSELDAEEEQQAG